MEKWEKGPPGRGKGECKDTRCEGAGVLMGREAQDSSAQVSVAGHQMGEVCVCVGGGGNE